MTSILCSRCGQPVETLNGHLNGCPSTENERKPLAPHVVSNLAARAQRDLAEGPYESVSSRIPARMLLSLCEEVAYWRQQAIPPGEEGK